MKKILVASMLFFSLLLSANADAQTLKEKLKVFADAKKKEAKEKADAKINQKSSAAIDTAINTPESVLRRKKEKRSANKTNTSPADANSTNSNNSSTSSTDNSQANSPTENNTETPNWKKTGYTPILFQI
ncbi:MAG: hypothetical protein WKF59_16775 [Chitinophagaceae bacterium]